jgi:N6-adenosine-specific RNA methylase IME4
LKYNVILADPPVPFEVWGKRPGGTDSRAAEAHYSTMTWADLNGLGDAVQSVATDDCCLFLWMCQPLLIETLAMAKAWGFEYKTKAFSWCKTYTSRASFFVGMGYWTRANTEDVLLFTRGNPRRAHKDVYQLLVTLEADPYSTPAVIAPMTRHSEKPAEIHERIERLVSGNYLELFGRRPRAGWQVVGNELDGLDIRDSLARLAADQTLPIVDAPAVGQAAMELEAA